MHEKYFSMVQNPAVVKILTYSLGLTHIFVWPWTFVCRLITGRQYLTAVSIDRQKELKYFCRRALQSLVINILVKIYICIYIDLHTYLECSRAETAVAGMGIVHGRSPAVDHWTTGQPPTAEGRRDGGTGTGQQENDSNIVFFCLSMCVYSVLVSFVLKHLILSSF